MKVRKHREGLRRQGLRPIQIWVPDVRAPAFRSQAHRQSLAVSASRNAREEQAFIDAVVRLERRVAQDQAWRLRRAARHTRE